MTYDREVVKIELSKLAAWNRGQLPPAPRITDVLPSAQVERGNWKYTTEQPGADWFKAGFNDSSWRTGPAGFGTSGTPGSTVRTTWNTGDIWLRRTFDAAAQGKGVLKLVIHHDEDAEVYLNGIKAASLSGFVSDYQTVEISPEAAAALKPTGNVLAVHCRQTMGGQYIDVGLVRVENP
jgi:hypothetical protein